MTRLLPLKLSVAASARRAVVHESYTIFLYAFIHERAFERDVSLHY